MSLRVMVPLIAIPALAAACGATVAHQPALKGAGPCPQHVLYRASSLAPIGVVLRAAQRSLAHVTLNSQGTLYRLTPRNAPIDLVEHGLAYDNKSMVLWNRATPGALTILRAAEAQCGRRLAEASWAVHYSIPVSVIAGPGTYAFFVKTRSGWRFWGNWCGAGRPKAYRAQFCR